MNAETPWTDDLVLRLRKLWTEGQPASEIARRLRRSKNAVVAKADRIGLPGRPSPIRQASAQTPRAQPLPPGARTLPPLPSEMGQ